MNIEEIIESFEYLDDWEDRYSYVIDLGKTLTPFPEEARNEDNRVRGCSSQVWLLTEKSNCSSGDTILSFLGDSDAQIVKGLVAITLAMFSGKTVTEIAALDSEALFAKMGLEDHLSRQRANGLQSMVQRIKSEAEKA